MFNNYLWVKIYSIKDKYDWTHLVSVSREKPLQEDDESFVDINPVQLENNSDENLDEVYLIFHFFDNYSDVQLIFTDYQKAIDTFKEYLDNQKRDLDIINQIEPACIVVERDENFTASTIYLKDQYGLDYDKYSLSSSPEGRYFNLYYPDKGDRWVLQKIKIT